MNRLERFQDIGDLSLIAAVAICALGIFFLIPMNYRLKAVLFGMAFVQTLARLTDLGPIASFAMLSISGFYCLIIFSVLCFHPKRTQFSTWTWLLLSSSGMVILYVSFATDAILAMIIRTQWLLLSVAASLLATIANDQKKLLGIIEPICIGLGMGCAICTVPLLLDPATAFRTGIGRFVPYGSNPNQIGTAFAMAAILGMYVWLRSDRSLARHLCGAAGALGFILMVITVSRMALLTCAVAYVALIPTLARRPIYTVAIVCILCTGLWKLLSIADETSFDRFDRGLDRSGQWESGYREFVKRPVMGLFGTRGIAAMETEENSHNAYLAFLYLGGLSLGLPLFASQFRALIAAWQVWRSRDRSPFDPVLLSLLGCCSLMHVVNGFANEIIYYPVYSWAFLNVFCISFFTGQLQRRYMQVRLTLPIPSLLISSRIPANKTQTLPATIGRAT